MKLQISCISTFCADPSHKVLLLEGRIALVVFTILKDLGCVFHNNKFLLECGSNSSPKNRKEIFVSLKKCDADYKWTKLHSYLCTHEVHLLFEVL